MNITFQQLSYIVALDTHRNFATAAKHCHVSQPALSMQIRKLEDQLDVMIFDRSRQPVLPTEAGKKIIEQARITLREMARFQDIIDTAHGEMKGEFRLGVIPTIAPYLLPLFLRSFSEKYPNIQLVIEELQTGQIIEKIHHDRLDAAILATPLHVNSIAERPLYYEPFVAYISQEHELYCQKKVKASELKLSDIWLLNDGHCFRNQILNLCGKSKGRSGDTPKGMTFEGGNLETLRKLVEQNFGLTLLPWLAAEEIREEGRDERIREFYEPIPRREVSIVYERAGLKLHIINALAACITAALPAKLVRKSKDAVPLPVTVGD